ncbi:PQQ-binding-like beta-propeller repeat protein [Desulfosporosinus sp.]|uniref:outer membrane protein assembly factor BamB family protein n=1 Tax=Desulfosporosinus sp. TaxID=157907 RepID=UPI0025B7B0F3|nr:PQQ-binding-like beta-propeller repeat protein [Desulfosporosinus sp.]MBC2722191.1 PQQ-binding-like beta-propeller repeat protein [Desulfosporosinus sp.]MBC2726045.1 PQQ-binding-like beta-propeller repeat protein [Desulfosporosinus sp.]
MGIRKKLLSKVLKQKILALSLVGLMLFVGVIPISPNIAKAELTQFEQGLGYQQGQYDRFAEQPTVFNWTRQSRFKGPGPSSAQIQWRFDINSVGYYGIPLSPVIGSDGTIFIGRDKLYAINQDGTEKWNCAAVVNVNSNPTVGTDGTIYDGADKLYAIDKSGYKKWDFAAVVALGTSPAIASDGTVYISAADSSLYAINSDGSLKWRFPTEGFIESSPAVALDGTIYIGCGDKKIYAVNSDGTIKWQFTTGGIVSSSPVIGADGTIYIGSDDKNLYALNPDGTKKWDFPTGGTIRSSAAISSDETIFFGSNDGNFYAVKPDGSERWEYQSGHYKFLSAPVIGSDGTVYVGSNNSELIAFNPIGGLKWASWIGGDSGSPALGSDGKIYIATKDLLYALGNEKPYTPHGLRASGISTTEISLAWQSQSRATSYNIYRAKSSNGIYSKIGTSTNPSYTDKDLVFTTTYWYKVSAENSNGESPLSSEVSAKALDPNTPTGLKVELTNPQETYLSWNSVPGAESYNIYRTQNWYGNQNYTLIGASTEPEYLDTGLSTYSSYFYKVSAVTQTGPSEPSSAVEIYIQNIPEISIQSVSLSPSTASIGQIVEINLEAQEEGHPIQAADVRLAINAESTGIAHCLYDPASNSLVGQYVVSKSDLKDYPSALLSVASINVQSSQPGYSKSLSAPKDFTSPQITINDSEINITLLSDKTTLVPNSSPATLTAVVTDQMGDPIPNAGVTFYYYFMENEDAWYDLPLVQTDGNGVATAQFTSSSSSGTVCLIAEVGGVASADTLKLLQIQCEQALTIITPILPGAFQGVEYQGILQATGGIAPYEWSAEGLPEGLNLDPSTGVITGTPNTTGTTTLEITVTSATGTKAQTELLFTCWAKSSNEYSALSLVQLGENPTNNDAGLYIGLTAIQDTQGNVCPDRTIAGYKIEVDYDPENVRILDVVDVAQLGQFTKNLNEPGKIIVTDAGSVNTDSVDKLIFISLALTGSTKSPTNIKVRFLDLGDQDLNRIKPPIATILPFQRGKIISPLDGSGPNIVDTVAGLQYLAGLRESGLSEGDVNTINMASILPPGLGENFVQTNIKDIVALLQYLADLRNDTFDSIYTLPNE